MGATDRVAHCPVCLTEYRAGVSICPDDSTMLVPGPAPDPGDGRKIERGTIVVIRRPAHDPADMEAVDLFGREEHPVRVVLAILAREDAPDLIDALEAEGVGARLGDPTPEGGVQVIVHDHKLADAQAILVEFTGDPSLVDDVGVEDPQRHGDDEGWPDGRPDSDGSVGVSTGRLIDLATMADRLAEAGIDVRMEVPDPNVEGRPGVTGTLWVDRDAVTRAREILGIST